MGESACRPGSVRPLARGGDHPSGTAVADSLVRSTREHRAGRPRSLAQGTAGSPLDLAPGGVYRAAAVTCGAGGLLHHRFTLTPARRGGGLFSVALSRGSPRVGVTDHPALWSPDLPHRACARRDRPADSPVLRIRREHRASSRALPGRRTPHRVQQLGLERIGPANAPRVPGADRAVLRVTAEGVAVAHVAELPDAQRRRPWPGSSTGRSARALRREHAARRPR